MLLCVPGSRTSIGGGPVRKGRQPFGVNVTRGEFIAGNHLPEIFQIAFDAGQSGFRQRRLQAPARRLDGRPPSR